MPRCDAYGRPLCGYCLHPMERSERLDHFVGATKVIVFECLTCETVELCTVRERPAHQRAA